jgi:hypothetical protein
VCRFPIHPRRGAKRIHHFAHRRHNPRCRHRSEALIHLLAKEIIRLAGWVDVPGDEGNKQQKILFQAVHPERELSGFTFDLHAVTEDGTDLVIEILYRHGISDKKRRFLIANRINSLEIDVNGLYGQVDLETAVLETAPREWIFHGPVTSGSAGIFQRRDSYRKRDSTHHPTYSLQTLQGELNHLRRRFGPLATRRFTGTIVAIKPKRFGLPKAFRLAIRCDRLPDIYEHLALVEVADQPRWKNRLGALVTFTVNPDTGHFAFHRGTKTAVFFPRAMDIQACVKREACP